MRCGVQHRLATDSSTEPAFIHVQFILAVATTVHVYMRARSLLQLLLGRHGLRVVSDHVSTIMYALHRGDCVLYLCIVSVSLATTFQYYNALLLPHAR